MIADSPLPLASTGLVMPMRSAELAGGKWRVCRDVAEKKRALTHPVKPLEHPGQAQDVVGVEMRHEHLPELDQAHGGPQQLALRAFGAIEEEPLASPPHEQGGRSSLGRRHRAGGAEKDDVEIHGAILGLGPSSHP